MSVPAGANRRALSTRLSSAWRIRSGSRPARSVRSVPRPGTSLGQSRARPSVRSALSLSSRATSVGSSRKGKLPLVAPREQQQVVGKPGQARRLLRRARDGGQELLPAPAWPQSELELTPEDGKRCPQLVTGVGNEVPLPLQGPLQPLEEVVHGLRQGGDLVSGPRDRHRRGANRFGETATSRRSRSTGLSAAVGQDVGAQGRHEHEHRPANGELAYHPVDRVCRMTRARRRRRQPTRFGANGSARTRSCSPSRTWVTRIWPALARLSLALERMDRFQLPRWHARTRSGAVDELDRVLRRVGRAR